MRRSGHIAGLFFLAIAGTMALLAAAAAPYNPSRITGSYKVVIRGYYSGSGNAAVGAQDVNITARVTDEAGNSLNFHAASLDLKNGYFSGTATIGSATVTITGRVEPADGTIKAGRLVATYSVTSAGGTPIAGRIAGSR